MAAATRKELLKKVYTIVPPMLESFHKGQLGRVAVIGGSEDYTGAPYFSAMASAKLGADMVRLSIYQISNRILTFIVARDLRTWRRRGHQDLLTQPHGAPIHAPI
jgi:NAD(P)H-hydrate repair Nnr-like enzyme with NAD(P)H-hydrate dehydratase domain